MNTTPTSLYQAYLCRPLVTQGLWSAASPAFGRSAEGKNKAVKLALTVTVSDTPRPGDTADTADVSARGKAVSPYYWTLAEFCKEELLPFAFADAEEEQAQYTTAEPGGRRGPSGGTC